MATLKVQRAQSWMAPPMTRSEIVPYDPDAALRAAALATLARVEAVSPVWLVGKGNLCRFAQMLDARRAVDKPKVTPSRLAFRLRCSCWYAANAIIATQMPLDKLDGLSDTRAPAKYPPNAETKKAALRKISQAKTALDNAMQHLSSDVVSAFAEVDIGATETFRREIARLHSSVSVPLHFQRGRPALALFIEELHEIVFDLTGGWLRSRGAENDGFLSDWLHELARAMLPDFVSDNDIGQCIETAIRKVRK